MKTLSKMVMLGGAVAALAACAGVSQANDQTAAMDEGARIWRMTCSHCHNARPASEFDARQWRVIVSHMRTRADLTRSDADAVAAFLRAAAEGEAPAGASQ